MTFLDMLGAAEQRNQSLLCVGLDPDVSRLPAPFAGDASRIFDFCAAIVDATADVALAYKPQIAYFAANRAEAQLEQLVQHIRRTAPHVPVILDSNAATSAARPSNTPSNRSSAMAVMPLRFRLSWA